MTDTILLTGGTGMVGHNVLDAAATRGIKILAPRRAELDLADHTATDSYVRRVQPAMVIHTAGRVGGIEANMRNPVMFLTENWNMGQNIVMAARAAGVPRLLNLGSSCMYPKDSPHLLKEEDLLTGPLEPTNEAYAIAKCAVQRLCDYVRQEDSRFQYKTLIPCNLYGPYDNYNPHSSHLAAAVIHKLHEAKAKSDSVVTIWGDGTARREFLYAADIADAILSAIERFDTLPSVMNVGAGVDHSVNDHYEIAAKVVGYRGTFRHDLNKPVGMKRKLMDISQAAAWGWRAKTSLHDGLAKAYAFYLSTPIAKAS